MKKLTAEKCCQLLDSLNSNGMSILEGYYVEALEIALPILEQQERGDVPERQDSLKHVGYLFVNSGGGVVYSPSAFGMRGFTCAGKIYGDVSFQPEQPTNQNGEQ